MNKLFILSTFFFVISFTTRAQTKEETIAWITEKLQTHAGDWKVEVTKVTPCEISYVKKSKEINSYESREFQFNPSMSVWKKSTSDGFIAAESGAIIKEVTKGSIFSNWNGTKYRSDLYLPKQGVLDIEERFAKALNHLATFCEKKKETF